MTTATANPVATPAKAKVRLGDRVFSTSTVVAGSLILATLAAVAIFLASPLASYVTGTVIPVDGGSSRFAF